MIIRVGVGNNSKEMMLSAMRDIMNIIEKIAVQGGTAEDSMTPMSKLYNLVSDYIDEVGLSPERYVSQPQPQQPAPPQPDPAVVAIQTQAEVDKYSADKKAETELLIHQDKMQLEHKKHQDKTEIDREEVELKYGKLALDASK